jgi:hypothetical protein
MADGAAGVEAAGNRKAHKGMEMSAYLYSVFMCAEVQNRKTCFESLPNDEVGVH